jgi:hypothetical protein
VGSRGLAAALATTVGLAQLVGCGGGAGDGHGSQDTSPSAASGGANGTYHVAQTGNDDDPGSAARPWRTLQHAADGVAAGDTVHVHAGTYSVEGLTFSRSGSEGQPIVFSAATGEEVIVDGDVIVAPGTSYLQLTGFTVQGFRVWGVTLSGNNRHVTLSRLTVVGGEAGIRLTDGNSGEAPANGSVSDVVVEDSTIRDTVFTAVDCTPGPCDRATFRRLEIANAGIAGGFGGDGLGLERGQEVLVEDCLIHDNGGDGIDLNSRDFAGHVPGIVVRRNQVYRNHLQGIKLWGGGRMEANAIWGQGINPVMVGEYDSTVELVRNTIAYDMFDPAFGERDYSFVAGYPHDDTGIPARLDLTLTGNIFAFNTGPEQGGHTGIYLGQNVHLVEERDDVFFSREDGEIQAVFLGDRLISQSDIADGTWARLSGQGGGDLVADPLFVSAWPAVDLHLQAGSPAAGRGAY